MKIIVKKGKIVTFDDRGSVQEQLDNLNTLIIAVQRHAKGMQRVAGLAINGNPTVEENGLASMKRERRSQ